MFAVIETGGKQYKVSSGQKVKIEKVDAAEGANFAFDKVLLIAEQTRNNGQGTDAKVVVGTPYISGAKVEGKIVKQGRAKKIIVFRYHSKTRYRKKKGHRQFFSEIAITNIKA